MDGRAERREGGGRGCRAQRRSARVHGGGGQRERGRPGSEPMSTWPESRARTGQRARVAGASYSGTLQSKGQPLPARLRLRSLEPRSVSTASHSLLDASLLLPARAMASRKRARGQQGPPRSTEAQLALAAALDEARDFTSPHLAALDSSLRCPICTELYTAPVLLTTCSHSFDSRCLREYLARTKRCPTCSLEANEDRIRRNLALDELVRQWKAARFVTSPSVKLHALTTTSRAGPTSYASKPLASLPLPPAHRLPRLRLPLHRQVAHRTPHPPRPSAKPRVPRPPSSPNRATPRSSSTTARAPTSRLSRTAAEGRARVAAARGHARDRRRRSSGARKGGMVQGRAKAGPSSRTRTPQIVRAPHKVRESLQHAPLTQCVPSVRSLAHRPVPAVRRRLQERAHLAARRPVQRRRTCTVEQCSVGQAARREDRG